MGTAGEKEEIVSERFSALYLEPTPVRDQDWYGGPGRNDVLFGISDIM